MATSSYLLGVCLLFLWRLDDAYLWRLGLHGALFCLASTLALRLGQSGAPAIAVLFLYVTITAALYARVPESTDAGTLKMVIRDLAVITTLCLLGAIVGYEAHPYVLLGVIAYCLGLTWHDHFSPPDSLPPSS